MTGKAKKHAESLNQKVGSDNSEAGLPPSRLGLECSARLDGLGHQTPNLVERPRPSYSNKWRDRLKKYSKSETKTLHRTIPTARRLGQSFFPWNRLRPVAWLRSRQGLATAPDGPGPCTPASDIIH